MPLGAILGLGSAVVSIGGAIIGANSTKKAAKQAADTSVQTNAQNAALAREFHGDAKAALQPFTNRGNVAGNAFMELLGYGPAQPSAFAPPAVSAGPMAPVSPMAGGGYYPGDFNYDGRQFQGAGARIAALQDLPTWGAGGSWSPTMPALAALPAGVPGAVTATPSARSAFDTYRGSTGYDFRFNEGLRALNTGAASGGGLYSGAAEKAKMQFGQGIASDEFGRYMSYLSQPMSMGLSSASALAGVGQNTAGMITAGNTQAGNDVANSYLMRAAANSNMWNGIAGGIGSALGSSYRWWGS